MASSTPLYESSNSATALDVSTSVLLGTSTSSILSAGGKNKRGSVHFEPDTTTRATSAPPQDTTAQSNTSQHIHDLATNLAVAIPSAEAEISRIEEMERTFAKKRDARRKKLPTPTIDTVEWLERHPDVTLKELDIADSSKPVKAMAVEDALGMGRYVMRQDLRDWMDSVGKLSTNMRLNSVDWTSDDERELQDGINQQLQRATDQANDVRKQYVITTVRQIADMLAYISERGFTLSGELDGVDGQRYDETILQELRNHVHSWKKHIEEYGRPNAGVEDKPQDMDSQLKKKDEHGILAAARSEGMSLTKEQVNQVINAFYDQAPPQVYKKKEKIRAERRMVESLMREHAKVGAMRRRVSTLTKEKEDLQKRLDHANGEIRFMLSPVATADLKDLDLLRKQNDNIRVMSETLARSNVKQAEEDVAKLAQAHEALKAQHLKTLEEMTETKHAFATLSNRFEDLSGLWSQHMEWVSSQEEEKQNAYGGMSNEHESCLRTVNELLQLSSVSFTASVAEAKALIQEAHKDPALKDNADVMSMLQALARQTTARTAEWVKHATKYAYTESGKITLAELYECCGGANAAETMADDAIPSYCSPSVELYDRLQQRLDYALSELRTKFREMRFMKSTIKYVCNGLDMMAKGQYVDEKDYSGFPPVKDVEPDQDYAYCWVEETKLLSSTFGMMRGLLCEGDEQSDTVNALLAALETYNESGAAANMRRTASNKREKEQQRLKQAQEQKDAAKAGGASVETTALEESREVLFARVTSMRDYNPTRMPGEGSKKAKMAIDPTKIGLPQLDPKQSKAPMNAKRRSTNL